MPDLLTITRRGPLAVASVMARGRTSPRRIGEAIGCDLPEVPRATFSGDRTVIGTGPGAWLVIDVSASPDFAELLRERLAGLASVSDQSGAYVIHRLTGAGARTLLQRGAAIDFHPDHFTIGSAATTVIAHIGVVVWQVDEQPSYEVATLRSFAVSFRHWLDKSAAVS